MFEIREIFNPDEKSNICNDMFKALPNWFGVEASIVDYVEQVKKMPFYAAFDSVNPIGFVAIKVHNSFAAEVCVMGVLKEGLPDDEQPGVHVRKVNGKRLNDNEMVAYYAAVAKRLGGRAIARYRNAVCLVMGDSIMYEHFGEDIASTAFYIVDTPHAKRVEGFPLDCLSVGIQTGKYYYDKAESRSSEDSGQASGFRVFFKKVIGKGVIL